MSIEGMKLALEALDIAQAMLADLKSYHQPKMLQAYTALRQAIEQAQKQEPVAWMRKYETCTDCFVWEKTEDHTIPLYTSPPQRPAAVGEDTRREWVGLTDEAILLGAKALAKRHADSCGLDFDDVWRYYSNEHKDDAKAVLLAAHGIKGEA